MKIEIYDTTLRDGEQGAGIMLTVKDKLDIIDALDTIGVDCIEAGTYMNGSPDTADGAIFDRIDYASLHAGIAALCSTRHAGRTVLDDKSLIRLANTPIPIATVVGKSSLYHIETVLRTTPDENLAMIRETIEFLRSAGKRVIFDAEHFFDGYSDNPSYALRSVETAQKAGADTIVLCDTNGGMLPDIVGMVVSAVKEHFPSVNLGIHCHNDMGMAAAASVEAVLSGSSQVQGSISGVGERCGNSDLCTLIPLLQLKLGYDCVPPEKLAFLTRQARRINETANLPFNENSPFVGGYAFTHKAGTHIDGVSKAPRSFEHIAPELVGNERNTLVSGLSGRAAVHEKIITLNPGLDKSSPEVAEVLDSVREYESRGYRYENAEASLMLIIREALGMRRTFYSLKHYQITINESDAGTLCTALVKIAVDGCEEITAAEGEGPINAIDLALHRALSRFYPEIEHVRLTDYKVRVLDSGDATASKVRVLIETTDGFYIWRTIGVSADIVDASWQALSDAFEYLLYGIS